jgi:O-antigen/teichoic acid export membrane protein
MNRNFLLLRSVAFAFVTKLSGGATVFISLPIVSHGLSPSDYASFLTTINITATSGLLFYSFGVLYVREIAHAFAVGDPHLITAAIRNTFGSHVTLWSAVTLCLAIGVLAARNVISLNHSVLIGIALNSIQCAAGWGGIYRAADRSDYVSSIVQTISNIAMVSCLFLLSRNGGLSSTSAALAFFGIPAAGDVIIFLQLVISKRLNLQIDRSAISAFLARIPECITLSLSPIADYMKFYGSSMLVLLISNSYNYILFSASMVLMSRLVSPVTLITRPMMPAFIDALHREDIRWLDGLKKALFSAAALGTVVAAIAPFFVNQQILSAIFPKEVHDVPTIYVIFCSFSAFAFALVILLAPLYIGARRASFYGMSNLGFTLAGAAIGALLCLKFDASAMMGSLAVMMMICSLFLLASIDWTRDSHTVRKHAPRRFLSPCIGRSVTKPPQNNPPEGVVPIDKAFSPAHRRYDLPRVRGI